MSDHYSEQREHFVNKSSTPEAEKDLWQTPKALFDALDKEFDFDVDICASDENKLCKYWFSAEYSALEYNWCYQSAFMNPPYSETDTLLKRAAQQAKQNNINVVALVNANTDTKWFANTVKSANEIRLITGRVAFLKPDGTKANGNTKGQCLIIWRGNCKTPCLITMVDRKDLEA